MLLPDVQAADDRLRGLRLVRIARRRQRRHLLLLRPPQSRAVGLRAACCARSATTSASSRSSSTAVSALYVVSLAAHRGARRQHHGIGQSAGDAVAGPARRSSCSARSGADPVFELGRWWTVLSAGWLHGGVLHILFNMMWVRQLGPATADIYGPGRMVIIYTIAGAVGFLAQQSRPGTVMAWMPIPFLRGAADRRRVGADLRPARRARVLRPPRRQLASIRREAHGLCAHAGHHGIHPARRRQLRARAAVSSAAIWRGCWLDPLKPERMDHMCRRALVCLRRLDGARPIARVDRDLLRLPDPATRGSAVGESPLLRVEIDDPADRAPADAAEADPVAREHDAVGLRPVEPVRLVRRPFERADRRSSASSPPRSFSSHARCSRKSASISVFGRVALADLAPPLLDRAAVRLELLLLPRRRQRRAGRRRGRATSARPDRAAR